MVGQSTESIVIAPWPEARDADPEAEEHVEWLKAVLLGIRRIRAELNVAPGRPLDVQLQGGTSSDRTHLDCSESLLRGVGRVAGFEWVDDSVDASQCAVSLVDSLRVLIPLKGLVDVAEESKRLRKLLDKERKDLARSEGKLGNARFVDNAPEAVVAQEKERLASHQATVAELEAQLERLAALEA